MGLLTLTIRLVQTPYQSYLIIGTKILEKLSFFNLEMRKLFKYFLLEAVFLVMCDPGMNDL
jgi:hypothetical protein